jgi:hypothetical protein
MAEPTITFGTTSLFGTVTGWEAGNSSISATLQRANALASKGNEVASALFGDATNATQEFATASGTVAPTIPATLGKLCGGYVLTGISITTSATDFVKMSLTGHNHTENAHADTLQQGAHSITLSSAFGAVDWFSNTLGDNACVDSSSISITCQHRDVNCGTDGDHFIGENYNGHISATVTYHGVPSDLSSTGWDVTSTDTTGENTGFAKTTVTAEKAFALATPT